MIEVAENKISINGTRINFPIRIKQVLEIEDNILVCLAYDYKLDVGIEWNNGGKEKWKEINTNFKEPTLYCFDKIGVLKWEFGLIGYFDILKLDSMAIENDLRIKSWILLNPNKSKVFIVQGNDKFIVDYQTGEIYERFEMR